MERHFMQRIGTTPSPESTCILENNCFQILVYERANMYSGPVASNYNEHFFFRLRHFNSSLIGDYRSQPPRRDGDGYLDLSLAHQPYLTLIGPALPSRTRTFLIFNRRRTG